MINFTVPYSLSECVSRLETTQQIGVSYTPYTRVAFPTTSDTSVSFRYELWVGPLKLGTAQGALVRDGDSSTRVQGITLTNLLLQSIVVVAVMVAILLAWQSSGGNQTQFLPYALVFIVVGPGLSAILRSVVESSLRRALT